MLLNSKFQVFASTAEEIPDHILLKVAEDFCERSYIFRECESQRCDVFGLLVCLEKSGITMDYIQFNFGLFGRYREESLLSVECFRRSFNNLNMTQDMTSSLQYFHHQKRFGEVNFDHDTKSNTICFGAILYL